MHVTSAFNVEASINNTISAALAAFTGLPAWMPAPAFVFDWPDIEERLPCFSFAHFPGSLSDDYQGRAETYTTSVMRSTGILEVSVWVSRDQKYNGQDVWMPRQRFMVDMLKEVVVKNKTIRISDYITDAASPTTADYRVAMGDMNEVQVLQDANPAIERRRFLINYSWHLRAIN